MIEDINTILLYIFLILLLFCIMYIFIYSDQKISFYDNIDHIDTSIIKYKDTFENTTPYYSNDAGILYLQSLTDFNNYVIKNQNNLVNILVTIQNAKNATNTNNKVLVNSLTKLYYKQYLEFINKINAAVFNKSNQMTNPNKKIKKIAST